MKYSRFARSTVDITILGSYDASSNIGDPWPQLARQRYVLGM